MTWQDYSSKSNREVILKPFLLKRQPSIQIARCIQRLSLWCLRRRNHRAVDAKDTLLGQTD
jgi:hypothetical protein